MQNNLSEEEVQMVVKALNHYYAYLVATSRDDVRYKELAERIQLLRQSSRIRILDRCIRHFH